MLFYDLDCEKNEYLLDDDEEIIGVFGSKLDNKITRFGLLVWKPPRDWYNGFDKTQKSLAIKVNNKILPSLQSWTNLIWLKFN